MKYQQTRVYIFSALGLLLTLAATPAVSQINPVRLKVTKTLKKERVERDSGEKPLIQQVLYTVELSNASTAPVNDLVIKWAVLYKSEHYSSERKLMQGERTCTLGIGQKYLFETGALEVPLKKRGFYGSSERGFSVSSGSAADIIGYLVEVYDGTKIVASDGQPPDIKPQIKKAKIADEKNRGNSLKPEQEPPPKK